MKFLKKYGSFIVVGLVVLAMLLLLINPAAKLNDEGVFSGFQVIFGGKDGLLEAKASAVGIIGFILLIAGAALPFLPMGKPYVPIAAAVALLVGAIMLFLVPGGLSEHFNFKPAVGIILPGIVAILASLLQGFLVFMSWKK